ncbi:DNA-binding transcriptional regulator [Wenyingzhuangia sp. 2_MG-2023]|uniref:helix-turn-helix domain-containing protein n=1 Tax=Wenyingzhuangia sp. 2_MG-2023 TaxID=3062639 RepID=UPI0026E27AFC|nr:helix-turn-helix transcriptional regulator [Wenyingzhuangia sp. 2_MG-2023]MDO6737140.1 helix-turn-helix transcriptional regulator [Wenyingzhuangia sp. 2_MG-2023]
MDFTNIGIKKIRLKTKLTQGEFAESINVSVPSVQKWESGDRFPNRSTAKKIKEVYSDVISQIEKESIQSPGVLDAKAEESLKEIKEALSNIPDNLVLGYIMDNYERFKGNMSFRMLTEYHSNQMKSED